MASARNLHDELRLSLNDVLLAEKIEATRLLAQLGIEVIVIGLSIGKDGSKSPVGEGCGRASQFRLLDATMP